MQSETDLIRSIFAHDEQIGLDWRVVVATKRLPRKKALEDIEQEVNYLNSFYLDDLDKMLKQKFIKSTIWPSVIYISRGFNYS